MDSRKAALLSRFKSPLSRKWMLAEIVDAQDGQAQSSGRDQVTVTLAPCAGNNVVRDLAIKAYVQPAMEGDPPDALAKVRKRGGPFIRAVDPEFPELPHREGKGQYTVKTDIECTDPRTGEKHKFAAGQSIGFTEYNLIQGEIDAKTFDALETLGDKTDELKGTRLYIKPGKATYSEQYGMSQFINGFALEPPSGQDVAGEDDLIDREAQQALLAELGIELEE